MSYLQEAYDKVAMEDIDLLSKRFLRKSADFLETDHRTSRRNGRSHPVERLPTLRLLPFWTTTCGGFRQDTETATTERRSFTTGGVQHAEANTNGEAPNRISAVQIRANADTAKVSNAHAAPLGLNDNLVNAGKLLANQQNDGDSPVQSIVTGLHESSRRGMKDGLRRCTEPDNHSAVDVGDLRRGTKAVNVKKPQFSEAFPEAAIRE